MIRMRTPATAYVSFILRFSAVVRYIAYQKREGCRRPLPTNGHPSECQVAGAD